MTEQTKQIQKLTFSEKSSEIISGALEKYGLQKLQEEGLKKFLKAGTAGKREDIINNLPGPFMGRLLRQYSEGKIDIREFSEQLIKILGLPLNEAEEMTEGLIKKFTAAEDEKPAALQSKGPKRTDAYREAVV